MSENLQQILDEITVLTDEWYRLIGGEHHKDKDCHFYISTIWSYGAKPYYQPQHYGYVHDADGWDLEFPEYQPENIRNVFRGFDTYQAAAEWLKDKLAEMIRTEKQYQQMCEQENE